MSRYTIKGEEVHDSVSDSFLTVIELVDELEQRDEEIDRLKKKLAKALDVN